MYVYWIGNGCVPHIVMYWAALKHSPEYHILSTHNDLEKGKAVCQAHGQTVELFTAKTRVSGVLEMSFILSEASFVCSPNITA